MNLHSTILSIADNAKKSSQELTALTSKQRDTILQAMADSLDNNREAIKLANNRDIEKAKGNNLSDALLDRLKLSDERIDAMIQGFLQVIKLKDPIGEMLNEYSHPNGMVISKIRTPIGVIGIIYESRPNVTADVTSLCIKTANAVILRGGSDAKYSNQAIFKALLEGESQAGLSKNAVQLITTTDRDAVKELVQLTGKVDLVIPRGGEGLINSVMELARVPIIKHYKGLCHTYVDGHADLKQALAICENAKCQRPGVCNAMETLLIHKNIAAKFLPQMVEIFETQNVQLRGDEATRNIIKNMKPANEKDWNEEYLDLILAIKIVGDIDQAINHINIHGSHHSDAIITQDVSAQQRFTNEVDSAVVYVNASTRFTDGVEFGMGAEIGISTDKLHARGPMGLEELTTYKYIGIGNGQIKESC